MTPRARQRTGEEISRRTFLRGMGALAAISAMPPGMRRALELDDRAPRLVAPLAVAESATGLFRVIGWTGLAGPERDPYEPEPFSDAEPDSPPPVTRFDLLRHGVVLTSIATVETVRYWYPPGAEIVANEWDDLQVRISGQGTAVLYTDRGVGVARMQDY